MTIQPAVAWGGNPRLQTSNCEAPDEARPSKLTRAMNAMEWLGAVTNGDADIALVGAPISRCSISPSQAHLTPAAFRRSLARFATWDGDRGIDLEELRIRDLGDAVSDQDDADPRAAHGRIAIKVAEALRVAPVVVVIGGDNSVTQAAMGGAAQGDLSSDWGLLTLDAHHDVRPYPDGSTNGSPVRELIDRGLPPTRIAQIGAHGFANSREHSEWVTDQGVWVRRATQVRTRGIVTVLDDALGALGDAGAERLWVDLDVDVLDRAFAPACPASMPGGLHPNDAVEAAFRLGTNRRVTGFDLTEVDASVDTAGMTVRIMAAIFLSFCSGVIERQRRKLAAEAVAPA